MDNNLLTYYLIWILLGFGTIGFLFTLCMVLIVLIYKFGVR